MRVHRLAVLSMWAAGLAIAGPYDQPWSQVESGGNSEVRKESRLAISKIDGESLKNRRSSEALTPGKHVITVHYETAAGPKHEPTRELQMELDPCTRYRIVAKYSSTMTGPWEPKVYSEPITECVRKFKTGKGKAT